MTLVQYDDMIQTIPPDAAYQTFHKRILPRTSWRSQDFFDAHVFDSPLALGSGVSSPGEFHPKALADPYVNVSAHTAPIIQL